MTSGKAHDETPNGTGAAYKPEHIGAEIDRLRPHVEYHRVGGDAVQSGRVHLRHRRLAVVVSVAAVALLAPEPHAGTPRSARTNHAWHDPFEDVVVVGRGALWHCSGILVALNVVLTARHCLPVERIGRGEDVQRLRDVVAVERIETPAAAHLDLALLYLERPLEVSIRPRRGAGGDGPSGLVQVVGYGAADITGRLGHGRRRTKALMTSGWGCGRDDAHRMGCRPGEEMVVYGNAGRDSCDGDSGGPLFEVGVESGVPTWRLLAITSRPLPSAKVRCGEGGIYTRVDAAAAWLDERLRVSRGSSEVAP